MHKLLVFAALSSTALIAADPTGFHLWKAGDLKATEKKLSAKVDAQKISQQAMADAGNHTFSMTHREGPGIAEVHQKVTDIFVVESGEATLLVGGKVPGSKSTAANEFRGPKVEGGSEHKLTAGDIVTIPAGVPHQLLIDAGKQFTYFVVKVKQ